MQSTTISNLSEFNEIIENLKADHIDEILVFRGQASDKPLVPSILRGKGKFHSPGCNPTLMVNWQVYSKRLIKAFVNDFKQVQADAVMQHYGYRSFFIDVTSDPLIAAWFALHRFENKKTACYVDEDLKSALFQISKYSWAGQGFLYALVFSKEENNHFIDLVNMMPLGALRIHKQKAGALYYNRIKSIEKSIVLKVEIIDGSWLKESLQLTARDLFPLPKDDKFYQSLCTVPYFVSPDKDLERIKIGHPLLGDFPIYADSAKELVREFLPLTRLIDKVNLALKWNIASTVTDFEGQRLKVAGATRIAIEKLMIDKNLEDPKRYEKLQEVFPSNNLFFEFELGASIIDLSSTALKQFTRGIWVIIGKKTLKITELIDNFSEIFWGNECLYSKETFEILRDYSCTRNRSLNLQMVLEIAQGLKDGDFVLKQGAKGYLILEPASN